MSGLKLRLISSFIALVILFGPYFVFKTKGLIATAVIVTIVALIEYTFVAIRSAKGTPVVMTAFFAISLLIFSSSVEEFKLFPLHLSWGVLVTTYFSFLLWYLRGRMDNASLYGLISSSSLGFVYGAIGPAFCVRILYLTQEGDYRFFVLLGIVFIGDSCAYLGGRALSDFGPGKLMESVSPKKTWIGAICGLLGSLIIAGVFKPFGDLHLAYQLLLCVPVAMIAQTGDLFVSLIKRVAQVKDSGFIMPGHGGMLDRMDGLFFAAPVYYFLIVSWP